MEHQRTHEAVLVIIPQESRDELDEWMFSQDRGCWVPAMAVTMCPDVMSLVDFEMHALRHNACEPDKMYRPSLAKLLP
jgi:hypothetical protein